MKISKREQAKAIKNKQSKKKGLAGFLGKGPRVPAPLQEGTPINAVIQQRESRGTNRKEGKGKSPSTELTSLKRLMKVKATKQLKTEDKGERGQGDGQTLSKKSAKKLSRNGSDDKISHQSKRTKSDDQGSALGREQPNGAMVSLEAMKESLRKKGAGTVKPKRSKKKDKKTAMFAKAASNGASRKPEPKVKYNKCVVAFVIRVDKGKDTKVGFDKKIVAALSFLQTYIDKHAAFFSIDELDSSRPPIKEKADVPAFQIILRRYFDIPNKRAINSVN
jgi:hypothetical protein